LFGSNVPLSVVQFEPAPNGPQFVVLVQQAIDICSDVQSFLGLGVTEFEVAVDPVPAGLVKPNAKV